MILLFAFGFSETVFSQNISGIINAYSSVTSINQPVCVPCVSCTHTITVTNGSLFSVGDTAIIIQMKGATINTTNTNLGGQITAIGNAGNYELFEIASISGNVLTPLYPLVRSYDVAGQVQVVRVPTYSTGVNVNATLTSGDWDDATGEGGVLALRTTTLTLNANIDVVGKGFRGVQMGFNGTPDNCTINPTTAYVVNSATTFSFTKGTGIVLDDPNTNRGRAPRANGGGTGISGDSGGGGGSSYGAGGEGGKRWCDVNGANAGGLGGVSLAPYQALEKVFLGGAGGSGFVTTNNPATPSDGGGIVIILADEIVGNGFAINASGVNAAAVNPVGAPDGGGGGGAGGSVALEVTTYTGNLNIRVDGGEGQDLNTNSVHGPGGGGGGGVLLYSTASLPINVSVNATGGLGGEHTVAPQIGQRNGSQDGQAGGSISLYVPPQNPNYVNVDLDGVELECDLDDDNDGILDTDEFNSALPDPTANADGDALLNFNDSDQPGFVDINLDGVDDSYDTDLDGIINQFDLDSDNDGCSDANEYYNSSTADGGDGFVYGTNPISVNPDGTVIGAPYAGSYTNVITATTVSIVTQPANQSANVGGTETFSAVVSAINTTTFSSGTPNYTLPTPGTDVSGTTTYQWQENSGSGFTNITNGGIYSGANTATLTLTGITPSMNGYTYQVIVTHPNNICTNITSAVATLTLLDAIDDAAVTVTTGAVATTVPGSVITNDTLNGLPVTTVNTDVTVSASGPLSIDANGVITVAANTPSGTYTITYELCETGATPTPPGNCDTATATVIVDNVIDAVDDAAVTVTTGAVATTVPGSVITNDTINGVPVTIANTDVTVSTSGPLSIDANGVITVAANTPSGTYTITYELCETGATPTPPGNCDTATATVIVDNVIDAVDDAAVTVTTGAVATTVPGSVITNDTINGVPVTIANTDVTVSTSGPLSIDANGVITVAANTPSGTYTITYELCETGVTPTPPGNCDTATATVIVDNVIDAVDDAAVTVTTGAVATTVPGSVITNDTINGVPVTIANTDVTVSTSGPLSIDANGVITVAANTPSGTYTITYELCEVGASPANCDTAVATVVVANTIEANNDTVPSTGGNVTGNDTLNGVPVTATNSNVTPVTTGPLSIDANGDLTVAPNTPSGTYTITYQICEADPATGLNVAPANCDTAVATVVVANTIEANNDTVPSTGGNVTGNDTLNGVPVTATNSNVTPVTTGPLSIDANGDLTVAPNTPSGTYTITYQICEADPATGLNVAPANCDTAVATVVVANTIEANNDTVPSTGGNVTGNDTLNGVPVTATNSNVTPVTTGPLSIDANGDLTVAPNTPSGTYTITYQICEADPATGLNVAPANCDTAVATVVVANTIEANNDTVPSTGGNVTGNDTLNGVPVTAANSNVTPVTTGPLSIDANGDLTVAPNTPSGTYTITYQICEADPATGLNVAPANCDTAVATVVVANTIEANNDTVPSTGGNVTGNDTLNGVPVTATNSNVTPVTTGPLSIDANGDLTVAPNTPSGTYTITYQICEADPATGLNVAPANCDTAVATVVVANTIEANNDTVPSTGGNVTGNDTLNGVPVTAANSNVTPVTTGPLSIDANGDLTVAPNTPSGTYTITYQICEADPATGLNVAPANCDTAVATVVVANTIEANNDTVPSTGGNVTGNDTLNGVPVTATNSNVTPVTTGPLSIDANGDLTVAPNTPSGTYTITYQICEADPATGLNVAPANCDTAVATVVVANPIVANDDDYSGTPLTSNDTTPSVLLNDTLDGVVNPTIGTNPGQVTLTGVTVPSELTLNPDGTVTVNPNTPSGTYTLVYQICEVGATPTPPGNCDTATVTILVANPIVANDDDYSGTPLTSNDTTPSVLLNDTLDGVVNPTIGTNPGQVTLTGVTVPSELTLNPDGTVTVNPNTPSGTYTLVYQICEVGATPTPPGNCDTATVTVVVLNPIDAVNDPTQTVEINTPGPVFAANVLGNDTLDNAPATTTNTDVTPSTQGPLSIDVNGNVTIAPNTPAGTYTLVYELCETGAIPANCDSASITIIVETDSDGDGVPNIVEISDGTDPYDFCDFIPANVSEEQSQDFLDADCDGDGLTNGEEYGPTPTDPLDSDGDGTPDFLEPNNYQPSVDDLEIYNLVTPNGDNDNDVFTIRNIELFPDNTIEIYNRWGVLVYETRGYGQDGRYFRGISEGRVTISQSSELPVGTYFYVLKYRNGSGINRERSGYLYINR